MDRVFMLVSIFCFFMGLIQWSTGWFLASVLIGLVVIKMRDLGADKIYFGGRKK
jgi:hypothetical protein